MVSLIKFPRRWEDGSYNSASIPGSYWLKGTHWTGEWLNPHGNVTLGSNNYIPSEDKSFRAHDSNPKNVNSGCWRWE